MPWYKKPQFTALKPRPAAQQPHKVPDGLWHRCPACLAILYMRDFVANLRVCTQCGFHEKLSSKERIEMLVDEGSFQETDATVRALDPLGFSDSQPYTRRLESTRKKTGLMDAVRTGMATIGGQRVSLAVMDFAFIGGSMGSVVGEKVTRAIERAIGERTPMLTVVTSGGARMQESTYSLMQMAKTSAALARLDDARLPHIVILTNPSTAGVMASYGSLGDVIIGEPDALIGFAGPRVIEQTIKQTLPRGFQRSEFVKEHGFLDMVCPRSELRDTVERLLSLLSGPARETTEESSASASGNGHASAKAKRTGTTPPAAAKRPAGLKPKASARRKKA